MYFKDIIMNQLEVNLCELKDFWKNYENSFNETINF